MTGCSGPEEEDGEPETEDDLSAYRCESLPDAIEDEIGIGDE
ncbi:hypothetical protein [Halosolutus halophilus]|nr:hypothetical protein [Halosolutus halophilus]